MNNQTVIQAAGLVKNYGAVKALRGVNLNVGQGELYGFLGPNGAGKTTTIRCLLDLIRPNGGQVRVLGRDPQQDSVAVRQRVGYLPGELNLNANLKVAQALRYFGSLRSNSIDWNFVRALAGRLDLDLNLSIRNLSKGNKQKVGVVQALMNRPELLLLDEPTSGLDPLMQQEVYRLLKEAQANGATIFFSSHIISEVETIAEKVAIIRDGVIVEEAEPGRLTHMALRRVHVRFRDQIDVAPLAAIEGVEVINSNGVGSTFQVEGEMGKLIQALAPYPVVDFETERPSLEEIFLAFYKAHGVDKSPAEEV